MQNVVLTAEICECRICLHIGKVIVIISAAAEAHKMRCTPTGGITS